MKMPPSVKTRNNSLQSIQLLVPYSTPSKLIPSTLQSTRLLAVAVSCRLRWSVRRMNPTNPSVRCAGTILQHCPHDTRFEIVLSMAHLGAMQSSNGLMILAPLASNHQLLVQTPLVSMCSATVALIIRARPAINATGPTIGNRTWRYAPSK
jgi:hypothetical protein